MLIINVLLLLLQISTNFGEIFSESMMESDGFVIVYSISDSASFNIAVDILKNIFALDKYKSIILVGNKSDLVRKRAISREGK